MISHKDYLQGLHKSWEWVISLLLDVKVVTVFSLINVHFKFPSNIEILESMFGKGKWKSLLKLSSPSLIPLKRGLLRHLDLWYCQISIYFLWASLSQKIILSNFYIVAYLGQFFFRCTKKGRKKEKCKINKRNFYIPFTQIPQSRYFT